MYILVRDSVIEESFGHVVCGVAHGACACALKFKNDPDFTE